MQTPKQTIAAPAAEMQPPASHIAPLCKMPTVHQASTHGGAIPSEFTLRNAHHRRRMHETQVDVPYVVAWPGSTEVCFSMLGKMALRL